MTAIDSNLKSILKDGEVAKYVDGFNNKYAVTNMGRVFSAKRELTYTTLKGEKYIATIYRELKLFNVRGYKAVCLSKVDIYGVNTRKNYYVHELVFLSFYGMYNKAFFKIIHINKKKEDNRLNNLKLEFRQKDKDFIEKYKNQQKILQHLKDYSIAK